jgi:hypothetical protein
VRVVHQQVIDDHVEFGGESVQGSVHAGSFGIKVCGTPLILDALARHIVESRAVRGPLGTTRLDAIEAGDVQAATAEGQQLAAAESSEKRLSRPARLNQVAEQYEPLWKMATALAVPVALALLGVFTR